MASGVPIVSTRSGIPADLIESGANGLLVDIDNAEALASATGTLIENLELRSLLARGGLASIHAYDWPVVARRYAAELYTPVQRTSRRSP
jgi:glycosyltransferase involved in cell wall biosynthesis